MMRTIGGVVVPAVCAVGCANQFDEEDGALACDLPEPCGVVSLHSEGLELDPRADAECFYEVLTSGEPAHLRQEFITTSESYFDLYIRGDEPPVYVSTDCEYDGPCQAPEAWRCILDDAEYLNCAAEGEPPRVCGGMVNWCNTMSMIEPTCP
jgi:hypothetical protein